MKVVILAGGYGTRLSEETGVRPKPLVEIGGKPILWHIMKIYSYYGFNDFIILTGYKGNMIKEYFIDYYMHYNDITVDMLNNSVYIHNNRQEPWRVTMLYTGQDSMTGGRIAYSREYINNETFMLTYGDGVSDIDINKLLDFHKQHSGAVTMTSVMPDGRFGSLDVDKITGKINNFIEKPKGGGIDLSNANWINGGFFVCEPEVFDYINDGNETIFEQAPLTNLAKDGKLYAYKHTGFWKCMDTLKDKNDLTKMWLSDSAPWKLWKD